MKLWIVVNHFLRTPKFRELEERFSDAASYFGIEYQIVTNSECIIGCEDNRITAGIIPNGSDPVLFWDKDIRLGKALIKCGHRLYNSPKAIALCDDKTMSAIAIAGCKIRIPKTYISPMTYSNIGYTDLDFLKNISCKLDFPMIVKEAYGSFGQQVYLCSNYEELVDIVSSINSEAILFQEYIKSSHGRDVRLQVVGSTVTTAMYRYSVSDDFRANITNGGKMLPYTANDKEKEFALSIAKKLGLDFCGVDMLFGENKEPVLCEVNSNAHFVNIDNCTGSDTAKDIISYIISNHTGW